MHYIHRDLRPEPGRDRPSATRERKFWRRPPTDQRLGRGGLDRATVDEALCCAGRSFCCGCYNLRVIICARGRASSFFCRRGASCAAARFFGGASRRGLATGRGGAVRSDARGSTAARALFRTAAMPSWRRSCVYARGAAARAVFLRGAAMLGVWAMIRRGFSARGARLVHALALFALSNQRARLQPSIEKSS